MSNATVQFPLCGLAYGNGDRRLRVLSCMAHGVTSVGKLELARLTSEQADAVIADTPKCDAAKSFPKEHLRIVQLGRAFTGINFCHAGWVWNAAEQIDKFREEWKAKHQTAPTTRVLSDIAINTGWHNADYNFFAALCALMAAIGSKPYAIVTRSRIRAGMLGYSSGRLLFDKAGNLHDAGRALLALRTDGVNLPLATSNQARTLLDNIVKRGLSKRFALGHGRLTHYSKFLEPEEIARLLIKQAERTAENPELVPLRERLLALKSNAPLCGASPLCGEPSPHNEASPHNEENPAQSPPDTRPVTTQPPHNASSNASLNASINASIYDVGAFAPASRDADYIKDFQELKKSLGMPTP